MKRLFLVTRRYEEIILTDGDWEISDVWRQCHEEIDYQDQQVQEIKGPKDLIHGEDLNDCPMAIKCDMTLSEIFAEMKAESWERRRPVHVITDADVDEDEGIFACLGRVQAQDVGKVIYRVDSVFQVENDAQCQERRQTLSDVQVRKTLLMDKLLAKQAEVNVLLQEIAGS